MADTNITARAVTDVAEPEPFEKVDAAHVEEVVLARLTEEGVWRISEDALDIWSWTGFRLCLIMFVQGCNQAGYGIDWGVIGALMSVGNIAGAPFLSLADVIGRRGINFIGNMIVIVAAIMQGCAPNLSVLMAGRFLLGFGSAMMSSSQYMGEIAPVHLRGRLVGIFGACFQVGSLVMGGVMLGLSKISGNWSWRIPFLLEALFPLIVCLTIFVLTPETPRYYMMRGQREKAKQIIAKYHTTSGDVNEPIVNIVINQMEESLENKRAGFRNFWDYRVFFTKAVRYRLLVLILYSVFQQWNGGSIISYYMVPALETIGIDGTLQQLGISLGTTATYFVFTALGSFLVDKIRRRTLIFSGLISIIIFQTAATITSWQYSLTSSHAAAGLTIFWIFMFQTFSALLIATMHNLYPVEILSLALRAKGMGLYGLIQGGAGAIQTYGIGVGINKLGYKIWVVYIAYNCVQLGLSYLIFPETFGLSLEEIDAVFETKGVAPVKMSLEIQNAKKLREQIGRNEDI
uniref:Lactose permease n=1 Tax=Talaromyces marneffei PM1 TaxID=1077442 RepID=A0A093VJ78_TALMA